MDPTIQNTVNQRVAMQIGNLVIESITLQANVEALQAQVAELQKEQANGSRQPPAG